MKSLIQDLYLTNRAFVTDEYRDCLDHIDDTELPLKYHEFESGSTVWDSWVVPPKWTVNHGYVEDQDGNRIIDYDDHPLHLIAYSAAYEGWVDLDTLRDHVHHHPRLSNAIPWHFRLNYRPWESEWGFCTSAETLETLTDERYYVDIDTETEPGQLVVAEHTLEGNSPETIVLAAHLDHTGMANDDLAGVAVGIECMRRLAERTDRNYTYTLLIVPEMLGTAAFLERYTDRARDFECGVFIEMPGNDNRLLAQGTFDGDSRIDSATQNVLEHGDVDWEWGTFREQIGNDELILEAPGFEIPTVSLSRYPYPEYHTNLDNPSIIREDRLESYTEVLLEILGVLDRDFVPQRTFKGVPSLANPKYDLYLDPGQTAIAGEDEHEDQLAEFRNRLFRHLDGDDSALDIANRFDLPFEFIHDYLREFEATGLIEVHDHPMTRDDSSQ